MKFNITSNLNTNGGRNKWSVPIGTTRNIKGSSNRIYNYCSRTTDAPLYCMFQLPSRIPEPVTEPVPVPIKGFLNFSFNFTLTRSRTLSLQPSPDLILAVLPIVTLPGVFEITPNITITSNTVNVNIETFLYEQSSYPSNFGLTFNKTYVPPNLPVPPIQLTDFYNNIENLTLISGNNVPFDTQGSQFKNLDISFNLQSSFKPYFLPGTSLKSCFEECTLFNSDISIWDTSKVTDMSSMFFNAIFFNQPIGLWNTSNVTDMSYMFTSATAFNQPIGLWDVQKVENMTSMFQDAVNFKQGIFIWKPYACTNMTYMFRRVDMNNPNSATNQDNYNALLISWGGYPRLSLLQDSVNFSAGSSKYSSSMAIIGRSHLTTLTGIEVKGWTITDDGISRTLHFSYTYTGPGTINEEIVILNLPVIELVNIFTITPIVTITNNVDVDVQINAVFNESPSYPSDFGFTFNIPNLTTFYNDNTSNLTFISSNNFPFSKNGRQFFNLNNAFYILSDFNPLFLLGTSLDSCFYRCYLFNSNISSWYTQSVTDMNSMFYSAVNFNNGDLTNTGQNSLNWDTTNVTNMAFMFFYATSFNQRINFLTTLSVTSMFYMFHNASSFNNGDLTNTGQNPLNLNTSNVTSMGGMFEGALVFNQSINTSVNYWNTSNVTNMAGMFRGTQSFNKPIGNWDTSSVQSMSYMFNGAQSFNKPIGNWDTSSVESMTNMFEGAVNFNNGDLTNTGQTPLNWDTTKVTNMVLMFSYATAFNQRIIFLNTLSVTNMNYMFNFATSFNNGDLTNTGQNPLNLDTSNVTTMINMFVNAQSFNQPINTSVNYWNTSSVTDMSNMFRGAQSFNQPIGNWDTSSVQSMSYMFGDAQSFNQPIGNWDTSSVQYMNGMFGYAVNFNNGDLTNTGQNPLNLNTTNVVDMNQMFTFATSFNQPINTSGNYWNTSNVTIMGGMFWGAIKFKQNISTWSPYACTNMESMFLGVDMNSPDSDTNQDNYNALLTSWGITKLSNMQPNVPFTGGSSKYSGAQATTGRSNLDPDKGWTITDGGVV